MREQRGFTLIEISIVLVIIGLLLGGVLKGQELITSARVRNVISLQDGVKAAFFGFQDRYRAYPGDYAGAIANINGATQNGNGNGRVEAVATAPGPATEDIAVWEHLSRSSFINGSYTANSATPSSVTNVVNPYTVPMQLIEDTVYADVTAPVSKHNVKTGNLIPADIMAELDRKIDDGDALRGSFRFSAYAPGGAPPTAVGGCYTAVTGAWIITGTVSANCGGASLF